MMNIFIMHGELFVIYRDIFLYSYMINVFVTRNKFCIIHKKEKKVKRKEIETEVGKMKRKMKKPSDLCAP